MPPLFPEPWTEYIFNVLASSVYGPASRVWHLALRSRVNELSYTFITGVKTLGIKYTCLFLASKYIGGLSHGTFHLMMSVHFNLAV